jgi:LPPG:FO 2-phospho-L-lactate transferase
VKVVVLAGGVGGARLAFGFYRALPAGDLTVVVNTGDDFDHLGLRISPDIDTVTYTLAGIANREAGWGIDGDSFEALGALERVGGPSWFRLGDRDLATHLQRTALLSQGLRLTQVTERICEALSVGARILPMTDDIVATKVVAADGEIDFQDYFVRQRCEPIVRSIRFDGIETARPTREVVDALSAADGIVIAPSNPFVSVEPILALPLVRDLLASKPCLAVSPIVGGQAIKGPAAKMMRELGIDVSPAAVARRYAGLIGGFVMDQQDAPLGSEVRSLGLEVAVAQTIMRSDPEREALARVCLELLPRVAPRRVASGK